MWKALIGILDSTILSAMVPVCLLPAVDDARCCHKICSYNIIMFVNTCEFICLRLRYLLILSTYGFEGKEVLGYM